MATPAKATLNLKSMNDLTPDSDIWAMIPAGDPFVIVYFCRFIIF
jgi:hypothetical protein